jgi:hypothetical protein
MSLRTVVMAGATLGGTVGGASITLGVFRAGGKRYWASMTSLSVRYRPTRREEKRSRRLGDRFKAGSRPKVEEDTVNATHSHRKLFS